MDRIDIKVLNKDFQLIAVVDSFQSLMWCKRYNEIGAIDLQLSATRENLEIFKEGNYIVRDDDDAVFRIMAIELDTEAGRDNSLIVGATDIKDILNQRVHYREETFNGTAETVIRNLIERNIISPSVLSRKIDNFVLGAHNGFTDVLETQVEFENVGELISDMCKAYEYGYKVTLQDGFFVFDIYKGVDRTQFNNSVSPVVFSSNYENLLTSKYKKDLTKFKNVAVVGGEGEGLNKKMHEVGTATGLDRYELYVNANAKSDNGNINNEQYLNLLTEKGKEALAKIKNTTSFEAEVSVNLFEYKKDFDLGDVVTVENEFGIYADARIVEIIETWEGGSYTFEPVFEFGEPVEVVPVEEGTLLAENGMALMSMRRSVTEPMTVEQPSDYAKGVKISELEVATSLTDGCCFPVVQGDETRRVTFGMVEDSLGIDGLKTYSSTEVKTNKTWINGKPIYRRVWVKNYKDTVTSGYYLLDTYANLPIDTVVDYYGYLFNSDLTRYYTPNVGTIYTNYSYNGTRAITAQCGISDENSGTKKQIIIVEYTKA